MLGLRRPGSRQWADRHESRGRCSYDGVLPQIRTRHHQTHRLQPHPHTRAPGPVAGDLGSQLGTVPGRKAEPAGGYGGGGGGTARRRPRGTGCPPAQTAQNAAHKPPPQHKCSIAFIRPWPNTDVAQLLHVLADGNCAVSLGERACHP
jgi:hypothetical protein